MTIILICGTVTSAMQSIMVPARAFGGATSGMQRSYHGDYCRTRQRKYEALFREVFMVGGP
ncbi:hypothetical protein BOC49_21705 (plasmid) [Burkholderia pseudomallei]|nr:hypothetical protein BOC49_21705 [Burkholderia pseudomallei]